MEWEKWGGPTIWKKVALLHGWEEMAMTVHEIHWPQNGYDCGPIACQVMEHIWTAGFEQDVDRIWIKPALPCTDKFRIRMALDSQEHVKEFVSQLQTTDMRKDLDEDLAPLWRVLDGPLTELTNHDWTREWCTTPIKIYFYSLRENVCNQFHIPPPDPGQSTICAILRFHNFPDESV